MKCADGSSGHYDIIYKIEQQNFSVLTVRQPNGSQLYDLNGDATSMYAYMFPNSWHDPANPGFEYGQGPSDFSYPQMQSQFESNPAFEHNDMYGTPTYNLPSVHPPMTFNQVEYPVSTHPPDRSYYAQTELYQPSPPPPPSRMPSASCAIPPPTPVATPSPGSSTGGPQIRHSEFSSAMRQHSNLPLDPRTFGT
jgi:hypothetical protein